jgi:threonine dehydrogenase-like Zn-dependent dehydrogenase
MSRKKIDVRPLISHEFALSEAAHAMDVQQTRPHERIKILLKPWRM